MSDKHSPSHTASGATLSPELLHDLRTPLNQILGYSEMLIEQAEEEAQHGFVPDLQNIQAAGRNLLSLLNSGRTSSAQAALVTTPSAASKRPQTVVAPKIADPETAQALILVVDDSKMNRDVLSHRLKRQGYAVAVAENGTEAMEQMRAQAFDLMLLDIMMPGIDGYNVLQQIKADEALLHIPVIMISALDELDSVVRCIEMGAEDYLPKMADPTLFKVRISACLDKKRARDRERALFLQLEQNYKRLQHLEKLRDDLTHMIVHDLRTPLTSLLTGMQTLEMAGGLDEMQTEMVGISISGGETLLGMINSLLDVEKMESGTMPLDYTTVDAAALVAFATGQILSLCSQKNLTLTTHLATGLPAFQGDEGKLRRVLVNLLGNAIKFTPTDGVITVSVERDEQTPCLVFSVRDTGEGIPAEAFERIFEKFGQVESRKGGRTMSTGLGLTFCKLAVEAHGGSIRVASAPGEGSVFSFTIPL